MNRINQHSALAILFALVLFVGSYGTVRAQQAEAPQTESRTDSTACPMMGEGGMMGMENMDMQAMIERCPMMKDVMAKGASMQEMMEVCPMMKKMRDACPMMDGMMGEGGAVGSRMQRMHTAQPDAPNDTVRTAIVGSEQIIEIAVGPMGFEPQRFTLAAGVPARLVFTRTADGGCTQQVQIPAFGIEKTALPLNEEVAIEFTPDAAGAFAFACGMNMVQGTIVVEDGLRP